MSLKRFLLATAPLVLMLPFTAVAETVGSSSDTAPTVAEAKAPAGGAINVMSIKNAAVTHAELPELVKQVLLDDPDILRQVVKKMHDTQERQSKKEITASIEKHKDELYRDTKSPSAGNVKTSDITIVEFFDYHCGYCKRLLPDITQLIKTDPKVRVIFREFPILAEDSMSAARAALAVNNIDKDKYFDFHTALMRTGGQFDDKSLTAIARTVGIDPTQLKKEMESPEITALLDQTRALADDIGIRGTPALIIGDQLLPGAVPYDDIKRLITTARNGNNHEIKAIPKSSVEPPPSRDAN